MENIEDEIAKKFEKDKNSKKNLENPELERINKEKGRIAELIRQGYSEEAAEKKARKEDAEEAAEAAEGE